jgi:putative tricarboxylic transport membrane protein
VALGFGVIGYALRYFGVPILPMVLGVILGFMVESNYRRALVLSDGDHSTFFRDGIAAGLLVLAVIVMAGSVVRHYKERRS